MKDKKGNVLIIFLVVCLVSLAGIAGYFLLPPLLNKDFFKPREPVPVVDETANWKTYTSNKYGVEFKYPNGVTVNSNPDGKILIYNGYDNLVLETNSSNSVPEAKLPEVSSTPLLINNSTVSKIEVFKKSPGMNETYFTVVIQNPNVKSSIVARYYFLNGKINSGSNKLFDQILSTFNFLDQNTTGETLIIDFSTCQADRKRVDVAFGSTTYEITGKKLNVCEINYGGEVENPNWNGKLDTNCQVPITLGKVGFGKNNYGVDFSPIKNYCSTKNN